METYVSIFLIVFVIGAINWLIWFIRRTRSIFYKNFKGSYNASTSVVVPVFKEDKYILMNTVDSILVNDPDELILVLDYTEKENMVMIKNQYKRDKRVKAFFIEKAGKRPAIAAGIRVAKGEIVILVDSDTRWKSKRFLRNLLIPFADEKVGGVGTRQRVKKKESMGQKIADWMLDIKYTDYIASDSLSGSILCLSGRTAAYRRSVVLPVLNKLVREYYLGHKCIGGDDARLTSLVLEAGYKTVYQDNCVAESEFHASFLDYLKQKIRWSRNSFRTYTKNLTRKWPWKQRRIYYTMAAYHTMIPGLVQVFGLVIFLYAIYLGAYTAGAIWLVWIIISRGIKNYSHLRKEPKDVVLFPAVILYFYILSFIKIYAFLTMTNETWSGSRENYKIKNGKRV